MNAIGIATAILTLMAGIGVFLMACHLMSSHLESAGSKRLKQLFARVGGSKWTGVGIKRWNATTSSGLSKVNVHHRLERNIFPWRKMRNASQTI